VRPFLNDRAKIFMAKLDPIISGNYQYRRDAILKEFKLSPNMYLNKFNTMQKDRDETFNMFASRLQGLLQFYLESRSVNTFVRLSELLICDRIKTTLTEACLRHVLSVESATEGGWLGLRMLTDTIDRYVAAHPVSDKPQAFAIGQTNKDETDQGYGNRSTTEIKNTPVALTRTSPPRFGNGSVRNQESRNEIRRCFNCSSPGHVRSNYPLLKREQAGVRRVAVENPSCMIDNCGQQYGPNPSVVNGSLSGQCNDSIGRPITGRVNELNDSDVTIIDRGELGYHSQQQQTVTANQSELSDDFVSQIETSERGHAGNFMNEVGVSFVSSAPAAAAAVNHVPIQHVTTDCGSNHVDSVCRIKSELSPLEYIDVQVCGYNSDVTKVKSGLVDSGSEITCVRADLVSELSPVVKGEVVLKPFCGSPITADLICLQLRMYTDGTSAMSSEFVHVWCASVPELNDSLILTADTVQLLMNSCHDTCELPDDDVMPLTNVSRVATRSVVINWSSSVNGCTNDTTLQNNSAVNDNAGTSLNESASNIMSEDVVSADCLNDCDPSNVAYVRTKQQNDPTLRGCFKLAKVHVAYAFPFVAMFAIGMLLNIEMFWPLKLAIAIFYYFIWQYLNSRMLDYQVRLKIPIAWYLATKLWIYYTWFLYFWPYTCTAETLVPFLFKVGV